MTTLTPETLAELRTAVEKMTPEPWTTDDDSIAHGWIGYKGSCVAECVHIECIFDAHGIALLRNHAKALIDAAEAGKTAIDAIDRLRSRSVEDLMASLTALEKERASLRATNAELEGKLAEAEDARSLAAANLTHADEKIEELQAFIRGNQLASAADIIAERDEAQRKLALCRTALESIEAIPPVPFVLDQQVMAARTIEAMRTLARATLDQTKP